jgi:hypothetical protein
MGQKKMVVIAAESSRPFGVSVISVVVILFGLFTALLGVLEYLTGISTGILGTSRGAGYEFLGGPAGIAIGVAYILAGVGLWWLRRWAWWLAILAGIVGFALAFPSTIGMLIWGALLAYLFVVRGNFGVLHGNPQITSG